MKIIEDIIREINLKCTALNIKSLTIEQADENDEFKCNSHISDFYKGKIEGLSEAKKLLEEVKKLDEPQKPVVPGFVAELLDYYRQSPDVDLLALLITFKDWYYSTYSIAEDGDHEEAIDWLVKHPEIYMRAWLFGYEVEKELLYEVIIGDLYLIKKFNDRNDFCFDTSRSLCTWEKSAYQLTEPEIKAIDERFWAFAVPVEEEME